MADRRRINGPPSGTHPPIYTSSSSSSQSPSPHRTRAPKQLRKIFLRTSLTPSASGSSYLELAPSPSSQPHTLTSKPSTLKLTATVHGPHPLPRSAPYTPNLLLTCTLKFAPFASRTHRRGFVRDSSERDLAVHLETTLRGVIIGDRWPKSGVDICVTVLEGEDDGGSGGVGNMNVLAGAITAASAALVDAGIDCVDLVSGGVAALVPAESQSSQSQAAGARIQTQVVLDPCPSEHSTVLSACVVGYLAGRDEVTEIWMKGSVADSQGWGEESLLDSAVESAVAARTVLSAALVEATETRLGGQGVEEKAAHGNGNGNGVVNTGQDVEMAAA